MIDYHRRDHHDHFHCDTNRGRGPLPAAREAVFFTQEALGQLLGRRVAVTGRLADAVGPLQDFSGLPTRAFADMRVLRRVQRELFSRVAAGR